MEVLGERRPRAVPGCWALSSSFALCNSSSRRWFGSSTLANVSLSSVSSSGELKEPKRRLLESVAGESEAQLIAWGMVWGINWGVEMQSRRIGPLSCGIWRYLSVVSVRIAWSCVGEPSPQYHHPGIGSRNLKGLVSVESRQSSWGRVVGVVGWVYITKIKMRKNCGVLHKRVWNLRAYKEVLNIAVPLKFSHKFCSSLCK